MMKWLRSVIAWIKNLFSKKTMRRKISLYIADQLVDLDDQSFILFNYQMDDLSNPTIVKNSFSQQITLKGTPTNNRIFGHYFKADRRISNTGGETGTDFNASQKTPFTIYDEMGHILESGYIKLDSISRQRADIQYKVTLYEGLGSFFFALSYDGEGNKRTLADLDYLQTGSPDTELTFRISRSAIIDAWNALRGNDGGGEIVSVNTSTGEALNAAGSHLGGLNSNFIVKRFPVGGLGSVKVQGWEVGAFAVAYDSQGNILEVYSEGISYHYVEREIDLPVGATAIEVSGYEVGSYRDARAFYPEINPMWNVINFAPAYNGIPEGNFSPDKGLIIPSQMGLRDQITGQDDDAVTYGLKSGYALVNLAEAQDEWAVKDLRSYLQRPVLSMKAFWDAICNPENNGGFQVDASVIQEFSTFGNYSALWMTLPLISSIGSIKQESGDLTLTMSSTATSGNSVGRFDITGSVPAGTKVIANLHCKMRWNMPSGANSYNTLSPIASYRYGRNTTSHISAIFIQAVAYGSDDSIVGGSKIKVHAYGSRTMSAVAAQCGYTPAWAADYEGLNISEFTKVSAGVFEIPNELSFTVAAQNVAYYKILVSVYPGTRHTYEAGGSGRNTSSTSYSGDGSISTPVMYVDYDTGYTPASTFIAAGTTADTITYTSSESLRSGASITKAMLLSTSRTPAEYMLSFCKIFGLYFTYDNATKKVTILKRNDLYQDETIDLTRRVDLSKGVSIKPLVFDAKWYDFILEGVGGAFYDEYLNVEGIPYGIQRVNTGYDFNANSVNLMESVVFKNAATVLARSKYFNMITRAISDYTYPTSSFTDDGWYAGTTVGQPLSLTTQTGCLAIKVRVRQGDRFRLGTHAGDTGRAWYFLDSAENVVQMAIANFDGTANLTIPSGVSYLVAQSDLDACNLIKLGSSAFYPSPFLDKGNTYTLWSPDGETIDTDISCPPDSSTLEYYNDNPNYKGYDINSARKLELRSADNKPVDGADILVFHEGWDRYDYFKLTDDVPAMDVVNDGVPCWLLGAGGTGEDGLNIPIFQRYVYGNISRIEHSLDFGIPHQFDIPGVSIDPECTVYERGWRKYIADRYDVNTKVMTCRVNFAGIPVTQELLRKFYWYENSLWVLNAIRNYSLTTFDPVECEFVQVQDKDNYLNGQSY